MIPEKGRKRCFNHVFTCHAVFGGGGAADSLMSLLGNSAGNNENVFLMGSHSGRTVTFCLAYICIHHCFCRKKIINSFEMIRDEH